ncbi:unnamed protein product [Rotaria sp. Silwood1]|nr:unnamed protein product [Rotaria sp. Silwood1]
MLKTNPPKKTMMSYKSVFITLVIVIAGLDGKSTALLKNEPERCCYPTQYSSKISTSVDLVLPGDQTYSSYFEKLIQVSIVMSSVSPTSPIRYLANVLENLILEKSVASSIKTKDVLSVLQYYIKSFDEHWSYEKQQLHFDECITQIKNMLDTDELTTTDVETYLTINNAFEEFESTIATAVEEKHIELEGYQVISSALSQIRQTIITLFSRLIDVNKSLAKDLHQMKTKMINIEARLVNLEADSLAVKKANFIADLMAPLLDKIMDKMEEKAIDWYWYSPREFDRLKYYIDHDPNWINMHPIADIINDIAIIYGLAPGVLVEHLRFKQDRNSSTHYTKKIRTFALKSQEFRLSDFITEHDELEVLSELEKIILQPVFNNICKEIRTRQTTEAL